MPLSEAGALKSRVFQRELATFPSEEACGRFEAAVRYRDAAALGAISGNLAKWLSTNPLSVLVTSAPRGLPPLFHPLSGHAMARREVLSHASSTAAEAEALKELGSQWAAWTRAPGGDLTALLVQTCASVRREPVRMRRDGVGASTDLQGFSVQFPPAETVSSQLSRLADWQREHRSRSPLLRAVVALVIVLNCHPFSDGNGRTARVAFNAIFADGRNAPSLYIPLYELFALSLGGFEIRLRQAEITGNWDGVFQYFLTLIDLLVGGDLFEYRTFSECGSE